MPVKSTLRVRMGGQDAHYGGGLVAGSRVVDLFGDAATELLIRNDGDEGLFCAYENIEFLAPVRAGDFIEVQAEIVHVGNTSRRMKFEAFKVIEAEPDVSASAAKVMDSPQIVARAVGTCVVPKSLQRKIPR